MLPRQGVERIESERPGGGKVLTGVRGRVTSLDEPFGNVWLNVEPREVECLTGAGKLVFEFGEPKRRVAAPLVKTCGDVPTGEPLAYYSSRGMLALAINMGDAARTYGLKRGMSVVLSREP
jgi:S-adenosylmethionine hydrolase